MSTPRKPKRNRLGPSPKKWEEKINAVETAFKTLRTGKFVGDGIPYSHFIRDIGRQLALMAPTSLPSISPDEQIVIRVVKILGIIKDAPVSHTP